MKKITIQAAATREPYRRGGLALSTKIQDFEVTEQQLQRLNDDPSVIVSLLANSKAEPSDREIIEKLKEAWPSLTKDDFTKVGDLSVAKASAVLGFDLDRAKLNELKDELPDTPSFKPKQPEGQNNKGNTGGSENSDTKGSNETDSGGSEAGDTNGGEGK